MNSTRKGGMAGFTLIELMMVVAIIGILASVVFPKYVELRSKAFEADAKKQLGAIRSSVSIYYSDTNGVYPGNLTNGIVGSDRYLSRLPSITIPSVIAFANPGHGNVSGEKVQLAPDDLPESGAWIYRDSGSNWGMVSINCTHFDTRGTGWSLY